MFLLSLVLSASAQDCPTHELPNGLDATNESVVIIANGAGHGSGVVINGGGQVLTAAHVVGSSETVSVEIPGGMSLDGTVIRRDSELDLALVQLPGSGFPCVALATDREKVGTDLFVVGAPAGKDLAHSVSKGVVSGYPDARGGHLQTDASINPGNSGGPIFNTRGELTAVASFKVMGDGYEGLGFGVPVDRIREWLDADASLDQVGPSQGQLDHDAALETFKGEAILYQEWVGVSSTTGQVVSSGATPRKGVYGEPLSVAEFYDAIGEPELARDTRYNAALGNVTLGSFVVGLGGLIGLGLGAANLGDTPLDKGTKTLLGLGAAGTILGGAGLAITIPMARPAMTSMERRKMADDYNRDLADELGLLEK